MFKPAGVSLGANIKFGEKISTYPSIYDQNTEPQTEDPSFPFSDQPNPAKVKWTPLWGPLAPVS